MNEFTAAAMEIAKKAAAYLKDNQFGNLDLGFKGDTDLVTAMDRHSEEMITGFLTERFPEHTVVAEEGTDLEHQSEYAWYVDPLDGTVNYAHGIPWYAVSIGLMKNGAQVAGVVINPANGETFHAGKGEGAYLNGKPIRVSIQEELMKSLMTTGFPYTTHLNPDRIRRNFNKFLVSVQGIRRFGAAALDLAYIAAGRYDGYWEENLNPWDTAAGSLLVLEAGGKVTDYQNKPFSIFDKTIVASNGRIHSTMIDLLKE